jgi:hypothetical protein
MMGSDAEHGRLSDSGQHRLRRIGAEASCPSLLLLSRFTYLQIRNCLPPTDDEQGDEGGEGADDRADAAG